MTIDDVLRHVRRFWPFHLAGILAIGVLSNSATGSSVSGNGALAIASKTVQLSVIAPILALIVVNTSKWLAHQGIKKWNLPQREPPGEALVAAHVMVVLAFALGGFFE